jgi:uncharacterized Tic20 family protein
MMGADAGRGTHAARPTTKERPVTATSRTCPVCGSDVPDSVATTCPVCGADLPEVAAAPEPTEPTEATAALDTPHEPLLEERMQSTAPPPPPLGAVPPPPTHQAAAPHPSGIPAEYRTWAMLTHLSSFAGAMVALAFLGPLVMWLIKKDEHPFLDHHGKEALNFNLSLLLYMVIGIVGSILTIGLGLIAFLPALLVGFVVWVICSIQGAMKANNGEGYRYPVTIRFIAD